MNTRTPQNAARSAIAIASLALCATLHAQVLISNEGGTNTVGGTTISWSIGEPIIGTGTVPGGIVTQGFHQAAPVRLKLNIRAFLQGPYNSVNGAMNDGLRANGLLPLTEPYTGLGYPFVGGGGESTTQPIIDFPGSNAIIDWVLLELRDKNDNSSVTYSRSALLQADGDVVDTDGFSSVRFPLPPDDYYIVVLHRNHLGAMTLNAVPLSSAANMVNLTDGSTSTYGTNAQHISTGVRMLWCGDVSGDGALMYVGQGNDRDPILVEIGGTVPTATTTGYKAQDVNMDGTVKYVGQSNDRDPILQNIGGSVPTAIRNAQLP